ncbi:MAG: hypothetical protein N3D11_14800 [Candidatus Sumerlaeia bacterium]|nr:hypothetical protein [Candidatus Sumerlaeia bacterium]
MASEGNLPRLVPPDRVGAWTRSAPAPEAVTAETIFDYMNGAAELYLAFQFRGLDVWRYAHNDTTITVEAYEMGSPEEAFGVLSQDLGGEHVGIGQESLYAGGLLRFWQGRWFFRILAEVETAESRAAVLDLGRALAAQIPAEGRRPKLLELLPREGLTSESIHYFHTHLCLNSLYFFAVENVLHLSGQTNAVMGDYRLENQSASLLIVQYPNATSATMARDTFRAKLLANLALTPEPIELGRLESGEWIGLRLDGRYLVLAFRSRSRDLCERLLKAVILTKRGTQQ